MMTLQILAYVVLYLFGAFGTWVIASNLKMPGCLAPIAIVFWPLFPVALGLILAVAVVTAPYLDIAAKGSSD